MGRILVYAVINKNTLKQKVNIILTVWGIFSLLAIFIIFQRGINLEKKHVTIIELSENVKSEFFQSLIYREHFLLTGDTASFYPLMNHLHMAGEYLEEITRTASNDAENHSDSSHFLQRIPVMQNCLDKMEQIYAISAKTGDKTDLTEMTRMFVDYNLEFKEFENGLQKYLASENLNYKKIYSALVFGAFVILTISFIVISRLINALYITKRRLVEKTVETEQRERNRIAADLHDGLGSLLSGIHLYVKLLEAEVREGKNVTDHIVHLRQLSDQSLQNVKSVINNLEPLFLQKHGLVVSVERMFERMNKIGLMKFSFDTSGYHVSLSKSKDLILYRIISELANNALKHSGASWVDLKLESIRNMVYLHYYDNGIGFDPEAVHNGNGDKIGLQSMISRIESLDGKIDIKSKKGEGLSIELKFQYQKTKNHELK